MSTVPTQFSQWPGVARLILLSLAIGSVLPLWGQSSAAFWSSSDYQNRLILPNPDAPFSGDPPQSFAISLFSGGVGRPGNTAFPNDTRLWLERAAFGFPVAATLNQFDCPEGLAYVTWARVRFGEANVSDPGKALYLWGPKADPDLDGRDNLMEYAVGSDPLTSDSQSSIRQQVWEADGTNYMYVLFNRRLDDPDTQYFPAMSDDLVHWETTPPALEFYGTSPLGNGFEEVAYLSRSFSETNHSRFFRLIVYRRNSSPPFVNLIGPTTREIFVISNSIAMSADAYDADGCLSQVEFYANGVLIGRLDGAPFTFTWLPTQPGTYEITVRAIDHSGLVTTTPARSIIVDLDCDGDGIPDMRDPRRCIPNVPPTIGPISFASSANFHSESPICVGVQAVDPDTDPITYQLCSGTNVLVPSQSGNTLCWQPMSDSVGRLLLTVKTSDPWNAVSQQNRNLYVFRTPPRP